jgi:hypothetical protein
MLPWQANHEAFAGYRKCVAAATGLSVSMIDKMTQEPKPTGDGEHSFTERFIEAVRALRVAGAPTSEVLVHYLLRELGYYPPVRMDEVGEPASVSAAGDLMREAGEYLRDHGQYIQDGTIDLADAAKLEAQLADVAHVVARERHALLKFITDAEDLAVRRRVGPKSAPRFVESRRQMTA